MPKVLNLRKKTNNNAVVKTQPKETLNKEVALAVNETSDFDSQTKKPLPKISWDASSFYFNPHKRYLALVIMALALGGGGMIFFKKDMLTAIFLILSSLVLVLYSNKRPDRSKITIDQKGITIGENSFLYKDLKSFWIHYDPGYIKELSLEPRKWYIPYVKVSIENNSPVAIRSLLVNFIPEREHEHSLVDIIARKMGL